MGAYVFSSKKNIRRKGFAMAEAVAALFIVCFAIALVAGLATQVTNLGKSTRQTAAVVELRNKNNAITRNTDDWMSKMRSSLATNGIYAACLPHNGASSSVYKCPAPDNSILDRDAELKRIAGTQLHVVSAPIVDMLGDTLAGAEDAPLYLDLDGRPCSDATASTRCPLKSTGYFFRTNPLTNANPGDVRFVVKVERNALAVQSTANSTPVKTQYLSIDVGSQWLNVGGFCPSGTLLLGYLNGSPYCVNPAKTCAAGKISLGLDAAGAPICQTPPTCDKSGIALDSKTNTLVCSLNTPCENSQIFLGYFSGTGTPMCSSANLSCSSGSVQVGMKEVSGKLEASCELLPSCKDSEKIAYDGTKFQCQNASLASTCLAGEVVVGINTDGSAKCEASELSSNDLTCPDGQVMYGLNKDGSVKCRDEATRTIAGTAGTTGATGAAGATGATGTTTTQGSLSCKDFDNPTKSVSGTQKALCGNGINAWLYTPTGQMTAQKYCEENGYEIGVIREDHYNASTYQTAYYDSGYSSATPDASSVWREGACVSKVKSLRCCKSGGAGASPSPAVLYSKGTGHIPQNNQMSNSSKWIDMADATLLLTTAGYMGGAGGTGSGILITKDASGVWHANMSQNNYFWEGVVPTYPAQACLYQPGYNPPGNTSNPPYACVSASGNVLKFSTNGGFNFSYTKM